MKIAPDFGREVPPEGHAFEEELKALCLKYGFSIGSYSCFTLVIIDQVKRQRVGDIDTEDWFHRLN